MWSLQAVCQWVRSYGSFAWNSSMSTTLEADFEGRILDQMIYQRSAVRKRSGEKGEQDMEVEEDMRECGFRQWPTLSLTWQGGARVCPSPEVVSAVQESWTFILLGHSFICFRPLFLWLLQQAKLLACSFPLWSDVCTQVSPHSAPSWRTYLCSDEPCHWGFPWPCD